MAQKEQNSQMGSDDLKDFTEFTDLSGHFLLAMPGVDSGVFNGSVVYLFEHSPDGAAGVIINRATDVELSELVERLELEVSDELKQQWIFFGGPVQAMRAFILHPQLASEEGGKEILELNDSRDVLQEYLQGKWPEKNFICFGYAGWDEGQLEDELGQNVWLSIPADHELIFKHPVHDRYRAALAILGIEPSSLSSQVGHS